MTFHHLHSLTEVVWGTTSRTCTRLLEEAAAAVTITALQAIHLILTLNLTRAQIPIAVTAVHAEEEGGTAGADAAVATVQVDANTGQPLKSLQK